MQEEIMTSYRAYLSMNTDIKIPFLLLDAQSIIFACLHYINNVRMKKDCVDEDSKALVLFLLVARPFCDKGKQTSLVNIARFVVETFASTSIVLRLRHIGILESNESEKLGL
jgi:hypothetical protein